MGAASFNKHWGALLLVLDTLGLECICLRLLLNCAARAYVLFPQPEWQLEPPAQQVRTVAQVFIVYRMLGVTCSAFCALVLRRHLMVWAVFAPKLAFEIAFWLAQAATLLCGSPTSCPPSVFAATMPKRSGNDGPQEDDRVSIGEDAREGHGQRHGQGEHKKVQ